MPMVTSGGHFGPVLDLAWQPGAGQFVVTISSDQTARLHSYWSAKDGRQVGKRSGCLPAMDEFYHATITNHSLTRGRESAYTVRNGAELVSVRNFLICVQ